MPDIPRDVPAGTRVSLIEIARVFSAIGMQSFGGGVSGWIYREVAQKRQWLSEDDFFSGLALSQAMPGVNVVNLAIWIGWHLRGGAGIAAAFLGLVGMPMVCIAIVAALYQRWGDDRDIRMILSGTAMAALGISLSMGLRAGRRATAHPIAMALAVAAFVGVGVLQWPMVPVALALAALGAVWGYFSEPA